MDKVRIQAVPESYDEGTGRLTIAVSTDTRDDATGIMRWRGSLCTFVVSDARPRTTGPRSQNNCFGGWCAFIAKHLSVSDEAIRHAMKAYCYETRGYPGVVLPGGRVEMESTANLTVTQEMLLLDAVQEWFDQWLKPAGLELPKYREPKGA